MAEIIEGMADFQKKLQELELTVQRKLLIEAAKAGAKIVREDAARRAPRNTGRLSEGMTIKVSNRESDVHEATVEVGPDKRQFYGSFQEKGTKHHRAQPFLLPSLEANRARIAQVMKEILSDAIERVAR